MELTFRNLILFELIKIISSFIKKLNLLIVLVFEPLFHLFNKGFMVDLQLSDVLVQLEINSLKLCILHVKLCISNFRIDLSVISLRVSFRWFRSLTK